MSKSASMEPTPKDPLESTCAAISLGSFEWTMVDDALTVLALDDYRGFVTE